ncbi:PID-CTERM protein-sorting domain-containing protein [Hymenobacter terricola]|uniref:PID-CTERM protein-sorting domain-containing protein n=1 Tax=Hymenobacter terricola TaxID=2819236 RepID=UPI001B308EF2|nr:hypothetical protein [Hymenobacter terricola]
MKHYLFSAALLLAVWSLASVSALAQPGSGGPAPGTAPTDTPIDGGISLLLAGGVGYGLRKLQARRKAQQ